MRSVGQRADDDSIIVMDIFSKCALLFVRVVGCDLPFETSAEKTRDFK